MSGNIRSRERLLKGDNSKMFGTKEFKILQGDCVG